MTSRRHLEEVFLIRYLHWPVSPRLTSCDSSQSWSTLLLSPRSCLLSCLSLRWSKSSPSWQSHPSWIHPSFMSSSLPFIPQWVLALDCRYQTICILEDPTFSVIDRDHILCSSLERYSSHLLLLLCLHNCLHPENQASTIASGEGWSWIFHLTFLPLCVNANQVLLPYNKSTD